MTVPGWYSLLLLIGASWRSWHLIAMDDILDRPRNWALGIHKVSDRKGKREKVADWLECPYCSGFWVALGWWGAWEIWNVGTLVVAVPFVLSLGVIAAHKALSA